jgi:4-hydroxybenzoate polyprenyltransferase
LSSDVSRPEPRAKASWARVGDAIMVRHTLFSLPWALAAVLLVSAGHPDALTLVWVVLAALGARTAANAFNRLADEDFDKANPRTAGRELPVGHVNRGQLWLVTVAAAVVLVVAVIQMNFLCLVLLPVATVMVFGYSFTKQYTWLCHFWLGATCALAPLGAFLAFAGHFEARFVVLWGSVALWVAGFDILYAVQDIAFDRRTGLKSVPARFGARAAFWISRSCHLATLGGLVLTGFLWPLGPWYWGGVAAASALLAAEHVVARGGTERHFKIASYGLNEIVGVTVLGFTAVAVYTAPASGSSLAHWAQWLGLDVFSVDFFTLKGLLP